MNGIVFGLLIASFSLLIACATQRSDSSSLSNTISSQKELQHTEIELAAILYFVGEKSTNARSKTLENFFKKNAPTADNIADVVRERLELMINTPLSDADSFLIRNQGKVLGTLALLGEKKFALARDVAKDIMFTPNLSPEMYRFALSAHALSLIAVLDAASQEQENFSPSFWSLQNQQCRELCDSAGWVTLAEGGSNVLTERWYQTSIYGPKQFSIAHFTKPKWFGDFLDPQRPQKTKDEIDTKNPMQAMLELMKKNKLQDAGAIAKTHLDVTVSGKKCVPETIYAHHIHAQLKRRAQERVTFYKHQEKLVDSLAKSPCKATDFNMDEKQFLAFKVDAEVWLGRLLWEQGRTKDAFAVTQRALQTAEKNGLWELYVEATQVLVGRIGYEILSPEENIKLLTSIEKNAQRFDAQEFENWSQYRKGLFYFLGGHFDDAAKNFETLQSKTQDPSLKAASFYWLGRTKGAQKNETEAIANYVQVGTTDPLGIYDIFAGQMAGYPSGRISTLRETPFDSHWAQERDKWITLRPSKPFILLEPINWLRENFIPSKENKETENFTTSLRASLLLVSVLRASQPKMSFDSFTTFLRDTKTSAAALLQSESQWLRNTHLTRFTNDTRFAASREQIAWLLYVSGDYVNSILYIGNVKGKFEIRSTPNSFLYFIFYPRPFAEHYEYAAKTCEVDVDILYAISRQESLFQKEIVSHAGAIGLMQLMPSTAKRILNKFPEYQNKEIDLKDPRTNILAGACYMKDLLARYNQNIPFAVAAYNAGEAAVDRWVQNRLKIKDIPLFTEFVPFSETQKYVQRVLRNYYNIKWIYSEKKSVTDTTDKAP